MLPDEAGNEPRGASPESDQFPPPFESTRPTPAERIVALIEVALCSDYPTQFALALLFNAAGMSPLDERHQLVLSYVVTLSLVDTLLLIGLIVLFLRSHGESVRRVLLGTRSVVDEIRFGIPLMFAALGIGLAVLVGIQLLVPSLHNVPHNPLQDLIRRPRDAWVFAIVVVVAGGVREEIQRAFILHRFDVWLGGGAVGVVVGSVAFGFGHLLQGADAAIATGLLGVFWGVVYLRRRSVVAPMVSHSGFNLLEIAQYLVGGG